MHQVHDMMLAVARWQAKIVLALFFFFCSMKEGGLDSLPPFARAESSFPYEEMQALEDLFSSAGGEHWLWMRNETLFGSKWNFSSVQLDGRKEYLLNPCGGSNAPWQGISCSTLADTVVTLDLTQRNLSGLLPNSISQLHNLTALMFFNNGLHGHIPSSIGNLDKLVLLDIDTNSLTGPIPLSLSKLSMMTHIYLSENMLTGTIPPEFGELASIEYILLMSNSLTGTLPSSLGNLTKLIFLIFDYNLLSGTIPNELGQLNLVEDLGISNCDFTGSIPLELGKMQRLYYFYLQSNLLTGSLPPHLGNMTLVDFFGVSNNDLTGTIPTQLGQLINMGNLYMDNNYFSGTFPVEFNNCINLLVLRLQRNLLSGSLFGRLNAHPKVTNVDFSDNILSGSIPGSIFEIPNLLTIALTLNCFEGSLPQSMCSAVNVTIMSLDGLGVAKNCKHEVKVPLTGVTIDNTMLGTIPDCVWALPDLQVLQLSGNGLTGSLGGTLPSYSALETISIAHNRISGTIPTSFQSRSYAEVDMSYNKLTGYVEDFNASSGHEGTLVLEVNRLSGRLPSSMQKLSSGNGELNVLRGNVFSCDDLPESDKYRDEYTCGSADLERSMYGFVGVLGLAMMIVLIVVFVVKRDPNNKSTPAELLNNISKYFRYFVDCDSRIAPTSSWFQKICFFSYEIEKAAKVFWVLLALHLLVCVPLYVLKFSEIGAANANYSTHSVQYQWIFSIAFVSGNLPAVLLLFMWTCIIVTMTLMLARNGPLRRFLVEDEFMLTPPTSMSEYKIRSMSHADAKDLSAFTFAMVFFVNALVTCLVNGLYIYFTNQSLSPPSYLGLQIGVALFKVGWNMAVLPLLALRMKTPAKIVDMELALLIFNNILLPCLVTAFTSPACFQGLLVEPEEVSSQYTYTYCEFTFNDGETTFCNGYGSRTVYVSPLKPPFLYNNICTSIILTSYIPVYILVYTIQLVVSIFILAVLPSIKYSTIPQWLRKGLQGVFWPNHNWRLSGAVAPRDVLKATEIISFDILGPLAVFVTFGLTSPYLAIILVFTVCFKLYSWKVVIGRFVYTRIVSSQPTGKNTTAMSEEENPSDDGLLLLSMACYPVMHLLERGVKPILICSGLFYAFLCWDVAGDKVGWRVSFWAALAALAVPAMSILFMYLYNMLLDRYQVKRSEDSSDQKLSSDLKWSTEACLNPIQDEVNVEMRWSEH